MYNEADYYGFLFVRSDSGFSANRRRFKPTKPRSRPVLLGMSSRTLRELPSSKIRFSTGTVPIIAVWPESDAKNRKYTYRQIQK